MGDNASTSLSVSSESSSGTWHCKSALIKPLPQPAGKAPFKKLGGNGESLIGFVVNVSSREANRMNAGAAEMQP